MTVTPLNRLFRLSAGVLATSIALPEVAIAQTIRTVPSDYSCYNTEAIAINNWDTVNMPAYSQAAQRAGGQSLRVPGGNTANYWHWEDYRFTGANGQPTVADYGNNGGIVDWYNFNDQTNQFESRRPNQYPFFLPQELPNDVRFQYNNNATLENVEAFVSGASAEPIWVMNMTTSFLEKEIAHLQKAESLGMSVNRIELGNELYFSGITVPAPGTLGNYERQDFGGVPPQVGGLSTAADYATTAKEWADAVRVAFPNAQIALTGVADSSNPSPRINQWMAELRAPRGADNRSALEAADAFTIHPYYSASDLGITPADIGDRTRAGEIARDGLNKLRTILDDPEISANANGNKKVWVTEHNIIEPNDNVILGNTWVGALMVDLHGQEFLKDSRTEVSCAHVLTGNPQWQGIADEIGKVVDPNKRGTSDAFTNGTAGSPHAQPFSQTATGLVLGKSADVFVSGTATLLLEEEAAVAWRVEDEDAGTDKISAVNASDKDETLALPEGEIWEVLTFIGDPWATVDSEEDLEIALEILAGGSILNIPAFSKIIATASLTGDRPRQPAGEGEDTPPIIELAVRKPPRQPGSLVVSDAGVASTVATVTAIATGAESKESGSDATGSPASLTAQADSDVQSVPEPGVALGLGLSAAALALSRRQRRKTPIFSQK